VDSFDDLLAECDENGSAIAYNGRIIAHVIQEVLTDVASNFCYNSATDRYSLKHLGFYTQLCSRAAIAR
jgi:cytoplasmic FMR1 interacting protein